MTAGQVRVPYITAYSNEMVPHPLTFIAHPESTDGLRLSYADPIPQDWQLGVLWARQGLHRRGRPEWKIVNTVRQRRCLLRLLCQVCGLSAANPLDGRTYWVLADDPGDTSTDAGYTNAPPTCASCIPVAIATCPRLRRGARAYTVGGAEPYGVLADVLRPSGRRPVERERNTAIPLDSFHRLEYALAKQLLLVLDDLRPAPIQGRPGSGWPLS
ncbi:hypothetical protein [Nonomuraea guangzhouensis]|uniref:Uncharacterized protein n=1 Tax=Nonomuraea guangzhouensis TaxID=1291555 RepID=A0ABW4GWA5_9ACTN|nr:hypothetical protein [Nonomuraea guangzhouensis]